MGVGRVGRMFGFVSGSMEAECSAQLPVSMVRMAAVLMAVRPSTGRFSRGHPGAVVEACAFTFQGRLWAVAGAAAV